MGKKNTQDPEPAAPARAPAQVASGHMVAPGKSLCCTCVGIVDAGEPVTVGMLSPDKDAAREAFALHVKNGVIVPAK